MEKFVDGVADIEQRAVNCRCNPTLFHCTRFSKPFRKKLPGFEAARACTPAVDELVRL
jgi:hypothetical protein